MKAGNICRSGHPFTPENTYINPKGVRYCRMCARLRQRGIYAANFKGGTGLFVRRTRQEQRERI